MPSKKKSSVTARKLPELPEPGLVYLGRGGTFRRRQNRAFAGWMFTRKSAEWVYGPWVGTTSTAHYAVRADSEIAKLNKKKDPVMADADSEIAQRNRKKGPAEVLDTFLRILNEAYKEDPVAMHMLICGRVPCNDALAAHPTVQVERVHLTEPSYWAVGLLGILNGVCEELTGERIAAQFSDEDPATKQSKILGFVKYSSHV